MSPKGISTNSGPILRLCEKFEKKLSFLFDMNLNQNNVKHVFLYSASIKCITLCFYTLNTLSLPPEVSDPIVDPF